MSSSIPNPTFLLDENVNSRLYKFLRSQDIDVKLTAKSLPDKDVAEFCLKENRILITNDEDFLEYSDDEIYAVIWLRIPQNRPDILINSFKRLTSECRDFAGKVIILSESGWKDFPLYQNSIP